MMKKLLLFSMLTVGCSMFKAQNSTLTKLVDSLPAAGWDIIETYKNKLYTLPQHLGGNVYQVDTATGALTMVANIPTLPTGWQYNTKSGNFLFLKNKTIVAAQNVSGPESVYLAAGMGTVDTLLKNYNSFGQIRSIDTMAYILASNSTNVLKLAAGNLASPMQLLDSSLVFIKPAQNQKYMYYTRNTTASNQAPILKRTNGITKQTIETTSSTAYNIGMLGEINNDMYYTVSRRVAAMDTTWIKKCDVNGVTSVVDTILMKAFPDVNGLVMGNKLIIPFKRETSPYYQDLIVFDINTHSKVNVSQNSYYISTTNLQQTQVANNHFYYRTISPSKTYISDGTIAGTHNYTTSLGANTDLEFENYDYYQSAGNKAILCDEYPVAGLNNEYYYGDNNNVTKYTLFPAASSYASHFVKVGQTIFFRTRNAAYTKMSIIKQQGCGAPLGIPQSLLSHEKDIDFVVYPNPARSAVNIALSSLNETETTISVNNILGQTVYLSHLNSIQHTIDCSHFKNGIYFITIQSNHYKITKKIIIE